MLAKCLQDRCQSADLLIRDMGIGFQYDLRRLLQEPAGAERTDLVIAKHSGAEDDAQADLVGLAGSARMRCNSCSSV